MAIGTRTRWSFGQRTISCPNRSRLSSPDANSKTYTGTESHNRTRDRTIAVSVARQLCKRFRTYTISNNYSLVKKITMYNIHNNVPNLRSWNLKPSIECCAGITISRRFVIREKNIDRVWHSKRVKWFFVRHMLSSENVKGFLRTCKLWVYTTIWIDYLGTIHRSALIDRVSYTFVNV